MSIFISPSCVFSAEGADSGPDAGWVEMFDGKSMSGWTVPPIGGEGEVGIYPESEDDENSPKVIEMPMGYDVTMIEYQNEFPKTNYELEFVSRRVMGTDLFSACIFPVGDEMSSVVVGGWGGSVSGLSTLDGLDASENPTRTIIPTLNDKWYTTVIRVTEKSITASFDGKEFVNVPLGKYKLGLRNDTGLRKKPALLTWQSAGQIKQIRYRKLDQNNAAGPAARPVSGPIFDGTMKNWTVAKKWDFMDSGKVVAENGILKLGRGNPATGVVFDGKIPTMNYEIQYEARRVEGGDFFGSVIFPVNDSKIGFILGGWGGSLIGFSCVDGFSADENEAVAVREFTSNRWYKIRIRVEPNKLTVWIDGEEATSLTTTDRKLTNRLEMEPIEPFGFATWYTGAELKNITITPIKAEK